MAPRGALPVPARPQRRHNLRQEVADHIRDQILTGRLRPGHRVDQDGLARELGVSQLPVREALIALDQEGLVITVPRRGAYVRRLRPEDIADHYEIFGRVAGMAAARAATSLTDDQVAQLAALHDAMLEADDPHKQGQFNFDFHRIINTAASSDRLTFVLRLLSRSLLLHPGFVPEWSEVVGHQHGDILAALARRDPAAAQLAMERHLTTSGQQAVETLRGTGFFDDQAPPLPGE